jgi:hypothetical protein
MAFKNVLKVVTAVTTGDSPDPDADTPEETSRGSGNAPAAKSGGGREKPSGGRAAASSPYPEGWTQPKGWAEFTERLTKAGIPQSDHQAWLSEATAGREDSFGRAKLVLALAEGADLTVSQNTRAEMQRFVAQAFDGFAVKGPPWKVSALEDAYPSHEEYQAAQSDETEAMPAEPGDGDDVPF